MQYLDEKFGGYRYMPNAMADRTEIYYNDDKDHKNMIATRYVQMYNDPETYWIHNDAYEIYVRVMESH
ncbi:hypothetical protein Elgi_37800 [Paenibacillus elgii]|nr:hypothetical protein Elgi_37800 [Paenibacillus elgii]